MSRRVYTKDEAELVTEQLAGQADNYSGLNEAAYLGLSVTLNLFNDQVLTKVNRGKLIFEVELGQEYWRVVDEAVEAQS